jgi:peptidyl-prolyl cis-trans isomerase SurA
MKKSILVLFLITLFSVNYAQKNDDILFTYGNEPVTKSEFLNAFKKNNNLSTATEQEIREYLNLYINFKLKVKQGFVEGIDTNNSFKKELASYRSQSAQQYLIDKEVTDQLINEALERAKYHIRASHILISCPSTASPSDTLAAYKKTLEIREKIMKGVPFFDAAVQYSDDKSAQDQYNSQTKRWQYGNKGELGYFTVFDLIYPFETGAYETPVGTISMPIRSGYGYHLIYVQDKAPSMSKLTIKQIFIEDTLARTNLMSDLSKEKLSEIERRLTAGEKFEDVAKALSDDKATKEKGGELEPFAPNRRPGSFVQGCIGIKPGTYSLTPISSVMGWHIIKVENIEYINTSNDGYSHIMKNKISRDQRSHKSKESLTQKLKKEYKYNDKNKKKAFKFLAKNIPTNFFSNPDTTDLSKLPGIEKLKPLFTYADQVESVADFAKFISRFQGMEYKGDLEDFFNERFPYYVQEKILAYENSILEQKYPEFNELVTEYREGMVLFEINTIKVWNEALRDSIGIQSYYETVKDEYGKPFNEIRAIIVSEYQNELEKRWIFELKERYPVVINEKVFQSILKK